MKSDFTQIPNGLIEKLSKYRISGEENIILWVIIRKTYGFHKKKDKISFSQFINDSSFKNRQTVNRSIKKLVEKGVIKKDDGDINIYSINENYTEWKDVIKKDYTKNSVIKKDDSVSSKKITECNQNGLQSVIKKDTHKIKKEIYKENIKEICEETSQGKQINILIELFKEYNLTYEKLFSNKTERSVLERFIKKYTFERTEQMIKWGLENQDQYTAITKPTEFERNINKIILNRKEKVNNQDKFIDYDTAN